ncbi:MAG: periplasmic heavy metal sensor [bacterium]|nr:periplasmic heavy metal sensor [bacterium]
MRDKVILIVMIVSLAFNLGVLAMFVFKVFSHPRPEPPIDEVMKHRLELTREQEEEISEIREDMQRELQPLHKKMNKKRKEALRLLEEPELDTEKRDKLFAEIADLQMQIEIAMFDHFYEIKGELTPEQQEMFLDTIKTKFDPKGGPMHNGPGRGGRGPGFHGKRPFDKPFDKQMDKPSNERRNDYEEMEREFEGSPDGPRGPGGSPDSGEPGDSP